MFHRLLRRVEASNAFFTPYEAAPPAAPKAAALPAAANAGNTKASKGSIPPFCRLPLARRRRLGKARRLLPIFILVQRIGC